MVDLCKAYMHLLFGQVLCLSRKCRTAKRSLHSEHVNERLLIFNMHRNFKQPQVSGKFNKA